MVIMTYYDARLWEKVLRELNPSKECADRYKRYLRAFYNRPIDDTYRIIKGDYDGFVSLEQLPIDPEWSLVQARDWFKNNRYIPVFNSPYDCTGKPFTNDFKLFKRHGQWYVYHNVGFDV